MTDFEYNEEFFNDAVERWRECAQLLANNYSDARGAPAVPMVWAKLSPLNEAAGKVNEMADVVRDNLLDGGSYVMEDVANTVREIANNYLGVEEENVEIARYAPGYAPHPAWG